MVFIKQNEDAGFGILKAVYAYAPDETGLEQQSPSEDSLSHFCEQISYPRRAELARILTLPSVFG